MWDTQIERLAAIVVEDFGPDLSRTQFNDVVPMLFEGIAGFEHLTQQQQAFQLRATWVIYRKLVASANSH